MSLAQPDIEKVNSAQLFSNRLKHYERALSHLELALMSWPEFTGAHEARWGLRVAMLKASVEAAEAQIASIIHGHLVDEYPERTEDIDSLGGLVSAAQEMESLAYARASANDISLSGPARRRMATAMLFVVAIATGIMGYLEFFRTAPRTASEGLLVWGVGCILVTLLAFPMRKKAMANAAGRRALTALAMAPLMILLIRVVVFVRGLDPADHYSIECFVLAFACVAAMESFPRGPIFGLVSILLGVIALQMPDLGHAAFVGSLLLCSAGIVWQWSRALSDPSSPEIEAKES